MRIITKLMLLFKNNNNLLFIPISFIKILVFVNAVISPIFADGPYREYGYINGLFQDSVEYTGMQKMRSFYSKRAFEDDKSYKFVIKGKEKTKKSKKLFCDNETPPKKLENSFRIMSFNVHRFHKIYLGEKLKKNPQYAYNVIKNFGANIVLLQEIAPYVKNLEIAEKHKKSQASRELQVDFSMFDDLMGEIDYWQTIKINENELNPVEDVFRGKAIYAKNDIKIDGAKNGVLDKKNHCGYLRILFVFPGSSEKILLYNISLKNNISLKSDTRKTLRNIIEEDKKIYGTNNVVIMGDYGDLFTKEDIIFFGKNNLVFLNDSSVTTYYYYEDGSVNNFVFVSKEFLKKFEILNPKNKQESEKFVVVVKSDASDHWPIYIDFAFKKEPTVFKDPLIAALHLLKGKLLLLAKTLSGPKIEEEKEDLLEKIEGQIVEKKIEKPIISKEYKYKLSKELKDFEIYKKMFATSFVQKVSFLKEIKAKQREAELKGISLIKMFKDEKNAKNKKIKKAIKNDFNEPSTFPYTQSIMHMIMWAEPIIDFTIEKNNTFVSDLKIQKSPKPFAYTVKTPKKSILKLNDNSFAKTLKNYYQKILTIFKKKKKRAYLRNFIATLTEVIIRHYYNNPKHSDFINYKDKIVKIIFNEEMFKNHHVFYHGFRGDLGIFYDFIEAIDSFLDIEKKPEIMRLRTMLDNYTKYNTIQDLLKDLDPSKIPNLDHNRQFKKNVIAVNLALFGNLGYSLTGESSFFYFLTSMSILGVQQRSEMLRFFRSYGFKEKKLDKLLEIHEKFNVDAGGNLLQIIVDPKVVDDLGYVCAAYGVPLSGIDGLPDNCIAGDLFRRLEVKNFCKDYAQKSLSDILAEYRKDTFDPKHNTFFKENIRRDNINELQGRFLINPKYFCDETKMKIQRYFLKNVSAEEIAEHKQAFEKEVRKLLLDWVKHQREFKTAQSTSFEKLVNEQSEIVKKDLDDAIVAVMLDAIDPLLKNFKNDCLNPEKFANTIRETLFENTLSKEIQKKLIENIEMQRTWNQEKKAWEKSKKFSLDEMIEIDIDKILCWAIDESVGKYAWGKIIPSLAIKDKTDREKSIKEILTVYLIEDTLKNKNIGIFTVKKIEKDNKEALVECRKTFFKFLKNLSMTEVSKASECFKKNGLQYESCLNDNFSEILQKISIAKLKVTFEKRLNSEIDLRKKMIKGALSYALKIIVGKEAWDKINKNVQADKEALSLVLKKVIKDEKTRGLVLRKFIKRRDAKNDLNRKVSKNEKAQKEREGAQPRLEKMLRYVRAGNFKDTAQKGEVEKKLIEITIKEFSDFIKEYDENRSSEEDLKIYLKMVEKKPNMALESDMTPFMMACYHKKIDLVKKIYEVFENKELDLIGKNTNGKVSSFYQDGDGRDVLQVAVAAPDNEKVVNFLCEKYLKVFDINRKDVRGFTSVSYAVKNKAPNVLTALLAKQKGFRDDCMIDCMNNNAKGNPLILAVQNFEELDFKQYSNEFNIFKQVLEKTLVMPYLISDNDPDGSRPLIYYILKLKDYRWSFSIIKHMLEKLLPFNDMFQGKKQDVKGFYYFYLTKNFNSDPYLISFLADFYFGLRKQAYSLISILAEDEGAQQFFKNFLLLPSYLGIIVDVYTTSNVWGKNVSLAESIKAQEIFNQNQKNKKNYIFDVEKAIKDFDTSSTQPYFGANLLYRHADNNAAFLCNFMQELFNKDNMLEENKKQYKEKFIEPLKNNFIQQMSALAFDKKTEVKTIWGSVFDTISQIPRLLQYYPNNLNTNQIESNVKILFNGLSTCVVSTSDTPKFNGVINELNSFLSEWFSSFQKTEIYLNNVLQFEKNFNELKGEKLKLKNNEMSISSATQLYNENEQKFLKIQQRDQLLMDMQKLSNDIGQIQSYISFVQVLEEKTKNLLQEVEKININIKKFQQEQEQARQKNDVNLYWQYQNYISSLQNQSYQKYQEYSQHFNYASNFTGNLSQKNNELNQKNFDLNQKNNLLEVLNKEIKDLNLSYENYNSQKNTIVLQINQFNFSQEAIKKKIAELEEKMKYPPGLKENINNINMKNVLSNKLLVNLYCKALEEFKKLVPPPRK